MILHFIEYCLDFLGFGTDTNNNDLKTNNTKTINTKTKKEDK